MELVNQSRMSAAWIAGKIRFPAYSVTLVVKGTYGLVPNAPAVPVEEPPPPTGDKFADDNPEGAVTYSSDFAIFKPRTDLLLSGTCHAPGGRPTTTCPVTFGVGRWSKTLAVIGDRVWKKRLLGGSLSEPQPFTKMPITYDRAFGGQGYAKNPLGRGWNESAPEVGMPNIEYPDRITVNPKSKPDPAGFGPIPLAWPQRMAKAGSYGRSWFQQRWPWYPEDFDWGFWNAAPEDQQLPGYLKGDEEIRIENLIADAPSFRAQLPGVRVRCFIVELVRTREEFHEVRMELDTLHVDADAKTLTLVWRGNRDARSEKLHGYYYLYVVEEPLSRAPIPKEEHRLRMLALLADRAEEADSEPADPEADETPTKVPKSPRLKKKPEEEEDADPTGGLLDDAEKETAAAEAEAAAASQGPHVPPFPPPPEAPVSGLELREQLKSVLEETRKTVEATGKPVPSELDALLAALPSPQALADEEAAEEGQEEEPPAEGEEPDAGDPLSRDVIFARIASRGSFENEDLTGVQLEAVDLSGLCFQSAILAGANLRGANLANADFTGAVLAGGAMTRVIAKGAKFRGADLADTDLSGADLSEADLGEADLTRAKLTGARLEKAKCAQSIFEKANLSRADLRGADLTEADLSDCRIHRVDLGESDLAGACFVRAWGRGVRGPRARLKEAKFSEARLPGADFSDAEGEGSVWTQAELPGALFSRALLQKADFTGAYLADAKFGQANLRVARLAEAVLRRTEFTRSNLFRGDFAKADLTGADLRQANLYQSDFFETRTDRASFEGANLRRTLLSREK